LGRKARAERRVEKYHHEGLIAAQRGVGETVALDFERFGDGLSQVAYVGYVCEVFH
jgi:hypothetical protein